MRQESDELSTTRKLAEALLGGFLVRPDRPGSWMYDRSILDQAEAGLMNTVDVGVLQSTTHLHQTGAENR